MPSSHREYQRTIQRLLKEQDDEFNPESEVTVQTPNFEFLGDESELFDFSLEELRRFPRYLSDLALKSNPTIRTLDHYAFWAWTGAILSVYPTYTHSQYRHLIGELGTLVHNMLLGLRYTFLSTKIIDVKRGTEVQGLERTINVANQYNWINPSLHSVALHADRIAATAGFSTFDGLLKSHCNRVDSDTGNTKTSIEQDWRPDSQPIDGKTTYHDRIQIWREYQATPTVAQTITHINDLRRYDPDTLRNSIDGIDNRLKSELGSTNHFLRLLHQQRNDNIHGQRGTRTIGYTVMTLCCLLFWDIVKPDDYNRHRTYAAKKIKNWQHNKLYSANTPETYLPLLRQL